MKDSKLLLIGVHLEQSRLRRGEGRATDQTVSLWLIPIPDVLDRDTAIILGDGQARMQRDVFYALWRVHAQPFFSQ